MCGRELDQIDLQFEDNAAVCCALHLKAIRFSTKKGYPITGLEEFSKHERVLLFPCEQNLRRKHRDKRRLKASVTAKGANLKEARKNAYAATEWVQFKNKYKRNDIGKAIDEAFSDGQ